jgi:hypothetical protein
MVGGKGIKGKCGSKDGKRGSPLTPPSEDFGDSEFSEEQFSSEGKESPPPIPLSPLFDCSDDSVGLSAAERAYVRSVERAGLEGSDDLEEEDSSEDSKVEDSEEEDSGEEGGGGDDGSGYEGGDEGGISDNGSGKGRGSTSRGDDSGYDGGGEGGSDRGGNIKGDNGSSGRAATATLVARRHGHKYHYSVVVGSYSRSGRINGSGSG